MSGWIKLHRKTLENPIVCKDSDYLAVWIYLLLNATHKEHPALFKGEKITLKPGQLITGRKSISEQLSISDSKVKRILLEFESDQQIDRQRSNKNSLISIRNWEKYQFDDQQSDQQMTSKWPASDQQVTTNKNVRMKEYKNNTTTAITGSENPFTIFEREGFGWITSIVTDQLNELIETYSEQWVCEAMKEAVISGVRTLRYVEAILKRWKTQGIHSERRKPSAKHGSSTTRSDIDYDALSL